MADYQLTWNASPSSNVTAYAVTFLYNGTSQTPVIVQRSTANDASGYSLLLSAAIPSITLNPGDTIGDTLQADDVPDSLLSVGVVSPPLTVPTPPPVAPADPTNVVAGLV